MIRSRCLATKRCAGILATRRSRTVPRATDIIPEYMELSLRYLCNDIASCSQLIIPPPDVQMDELGSFFRIAESFPDVKDDPNLQKVIWHLIHFEKAGVLNRFLMELSQYYEAEQYIRILVQQLQQHS